MPSITEYLVVIYTLFWLILTLYLWLIYLPQRFRRDVLDGILEFLESDDKAEQDKINRIIKLSTEQMLLTMKEDEVVSKFIKNYLNGVSLAFMNIICARFGISPEKLKEFVSGAGVPTGADGNPDFMAMIQRNLLAKAPEIIEKGMTRVIDGLIGE